MDSMIGDDSRPSKRARRLDKSESSGSDGENGIANGEGNIPLKINEEYARRFEHNKKREEQHRLEEKYGAQSKLHVPGSDSDLDSESESEDEGEFATEKIDAQILDTLKAIRAKDPRVYDKNAKFFTNEDQEDVKKSKLKEEKPVHLRDYHREKLLGGDKLDDKVPTPSQFKEGGSEDLVRSIHTAALQEEDDSPHNDEGDFFQAKTKAENSHEDISAPLPDVSHAEDDPDGFLTDFVTSRAWAENSGAAFAPLESDDDEEDARREALEHAYNMRFEDPARANETIKTHSRLATEAQSARRRDLKGRKRTRESERAERELEQRKQDQEKRRLRALKIDEAQVKLQQFKEAAGMRNKSVTMEEWSKIFNGGWDSNKWDEEMARRFDDQYYEEDEGDGNVSDESQNDRVAQKKNLKKPQWNDDIDIKDIDSDSVNEDDANVFSLSDHDEGQDQGNEDRAEEAGGVSLDANDTANVQQKTNGEAEDMKSSRQKQSHRQAQQERKKIEELVDQGMITEGPSKTAKQPGLFRYRATSPSSFGLSATEILMADDSQLNQHAGLKKLASFRDPDKKHKDKRKLSKRARLREWRKETFGNEEGPEKSFQEHLKSQMQPGSGKGPKPVQDDTLNGADGDAKKKSKKKKRSRKRKADQVDDGPAAGQEEGV